MQIKDEIKMLAKSIMFDLSDIECNQIASEYHDIIEKLSIIDSTNVDELEPTNFVNKKILIDDLNNDVVKEYNPKEVFSNCKDFNNEYVVIKNEK